MENEVVRNEGNTSELEELIKSLDGIQKTIKILFNFRESDFFDIKVITKHPNNVVEIVFQANDIDSKDENVPKIISDLLLGFTEITNIISYQVIDNVDEDIQLIKLENDFGDELIIDIFSEEEVNYVYDPEDGIQNVNENGIAGALKSMSKALIKIRQLQTQPIEEIETKINIREKKEIPIIKATPMDPVILSIYEQLQEKERFFFLKRDNKYPELFTFRICTKDPVTGNYAFPFTSPLLRFNDSETNEVLKNVLSCLAELSPVVNKRELYTTDYNDMDYIETKSDNGDIFRTDILTMEELIEFFGENSDIYNAENAGFEFNLQCLVEAISKLKDLPPATESKKGTKIHSFKLAYDIKRKRIQNSQ